MTINRRDAIQNDISGVAGLNAELLEAAGVDTVKELPNPSAGNLAVAMKGINAKRKLARRQRACRLRPPTNRFKMRGGVRAVPLPDD